MLIELMFIAENFQCGAGAPMANFEVIVTESQGSDTITHSLTVGESLIIEEENLGIISVEGLNNANCAVIYDAIEATVDNIPDLPGLYNQPDVASYLDELQGAESIYLYEFGALNGPSADYQDVILKIDWNYTEEQEQKPELKPQPGQEESIIFAD